MNIRMLVLFTLLLVGCGNSNRPNTGSRQTLDQDYVRGLGITYPPKARPHERAWLRETLDKHIVVVMKHANKPYLEYVGVRFVKNRTALLAAHWRLMQSSNIKPGLIYHCTAMGFAHGKDLYQVASTWDSMEGPHLGHHLWHIYEDPDLFHTDKRWTRLLWDDQILSMVLKGQR